MLLVLLVLTSYAMPTLATWSEVLTRLRSAKVLEESVSLFFSATTTSDEELGELQTLQTMDMLEELYFNHVEVLVNETGWKDVSLETCLRCDNVLLEGQTWLLRLFSKESLSKNVWLLHDSEETRDVLRRSANLDLLSKVYLFNLSDEEVVLTEAYRVCPTCRLRVQKVRLAELRSEETIWDRRSDLSEMIFNVCVEHSPPLQIIPDDGGRPTGLFPDLFYEVREQLGFEINITISPDRKWGGQNDQGEWNGMVGMVVRHEADMAMSEFTMTEARRSAIDFSIPLMEDSVHFSMLRPGKASDWMIFVQVFTTQFWMALTLSFVLMYLSLLLIASQLDESYDRDQSMLMALEIVIFQGRNNYNFTSLAGRILFMSGAAVGLIAFTAYNAQLTSKLTVARYRLPLESLEELYESSVSQYTLLVMQATSYEAYFTSAAEGSLRNLVYNKFVKDRPQAMITGNDHGFQTAMEDPGNIFMVKRSTYEGSGHQCVLEQSARVLYTLQKGFIFQKGSPYTALFNHQLKRLIEDGVMERLKETRDFDMSNCEASVGPLDMTKLFTAFFLLPGGFALCLLTLALEMVRKRIWTKGLNYGQSNENVEADVPIPTLNFIH